MKKAVLSVKINVPDDFECGNCEQCPIHSERYCDNHYTARTEISCKLGYNETTCPIEFNDKNIM